ncbi:hypothetical protein [Streptomyces cavernae]|uniref:hypothetical protein n=1 Tax=Streptomyces cavernae TaxID=2259034 RepID=UPI001EE3DECB|nr:hypothetical protein [Streptomyces cavernae]
MAEAKLSATALPAHATAHPMANPGYGKLAAPDQLPRTNHDFAHLPNREASIASYIDRLPNGADISVKTLAKQLPYGQCALRTALNNLHREGHLRRGREQVSASDGGARWITRSWWSRTARDDGWWAAFTRGEVPKEPAEPPDTPDIPDTPDRPRQTRSRAHILLAALSRTAPVLTLSHTECMELAPLLAEWFTRGVTDEAVIQTLTAGLPTPVHHPAALLRNRLTNKLPPVREPREAPPPPRRLLECAECGVPGRPEALPGGFCRACRGDRAPGHEGPPLPDVRSHAAGIRTALLERRRERPPV